MTQPVGYFIQHPAYRADIHGQFYDYVFTGNGVFIHASNPLLSARVPVSECKIRGLLPWSPDVVLIHGKIPGLLFDLALTTALANKEKEIYFAITWKDDGYHVFKTAQDGKEAKVTYSVLENTVMDIHSHGKMSSSFSHQDDTDEQGLKLSCIIGNLEETPEVSVRIGVYGSFWELPWTEVFEGTLTGAYDSKLIMEEAIELQSTMPGEETIDRRGWWHRVFGH
jgi:PRTRC genetic system protein A